MSLTKDQYQWDCVANHLPDWIEDNDNVIDGYLSEKDYYILIALLDMYNDLSEKEKKIDAFDAYGIEDEKQDIINSIIKLYEKYKQYV